MKNAQDYPDFDNLPPVEGMPQGCSWGLFDTDGKKDRVGTLNFLTPDVVKAAAAEVKDGHSISLNWPINGMKIPTPGRTPPVHNVYSLKETYGCHGWDETMDFNTQCSSQWDSLVHFQHQDSGLAYNGVRCNKEGLNTPFTQQNTHPTLDHWHEKGGMVARGVLLDYKRYVQEKLGQDFSPMDGHRILVSELEAVADWQGVELKPADVLVVRTGFTEIMAAPPMEELAKMQKGTLAGVAGTLESAKWIWDKKFSAVAGDSISFEAYPPLKEDGTPGETRDLVLHPWLLSMFGMSIGELWDLKELSDYCKKTGRYSFMLTSAPLNHPGLVGSPPNALAIF